MDRVHQKAQQEQAKEVSQEMLDKLSELPAGLFIKKDELLKNIDDMIQTDESPQTIFRLPSKKEPWDFSMEKPRLYLYAGMEFSSTQSHRRMKDSTAAFVCSIRCRTERPTIPQKITK